jgi:uncharacterized protein (DUF1015 family)
MVAECGGRADGGTSRTACDDGTVPQFEPFPGTRYAADLDLAAVTSPPYDVIDAAEREALAASHPANAVHVDCPVGDLGSGREGVTGQGTDPYAEAARTFDRWRADGTLVTDAQPTFTIYRMSFVDEAGVERSTTGALGALTLERPGEGGILPHERTTPKAKSDRLDLLRATKANLSAIWGLSLAGGLSKLLRPSGDPVADLTDPDGVRHQAWVLDDPAACEAITAAVATAPVVIADGHHRFETSLAYRDEAPADAPGAVATLAFVVELVEEQLTVQPIHRLLDGFPEGFDVAGALAEAYEVTPAPSLAPGQLGLVTRDATYALAPRTDDGTLDTVRLDEALAGLPEHTLAYQHGVANVLAAVADGRAQAGVLLRPVTVDQIAAVADAAERMPPKTTFFAPKPRTGIVFRSLTDG